MHKESRKEAVGKDPSPLGFYYSSPEGYASQELDQIEQTSEQSGPLPAHFRDAYLCPTVRLISQYVLEVSERGPLLPYEDYELVLSWLEQSYWERDRVLLVVSEVLDGFYARKQEYPQTLKAIHKAVVKKLSCA